jgi:hypothetical protein
MKPVLIEDGLHLRVSDPEASYAKPCCDGLRVIFRRMNDRDQNVNHTRQVQLLWDCWRW